jgi:hypothetical protein
MAEPWRETQFVVRVRAIDIAAVVSVLLHLALFTFTKITPPDEVAGPITDMPLQVVLAPPQQAQADPVAPPAPTPPAQPQPQPERTPLAAIKPSPQAPRVPAPTPLPTPTPEPVTPPPPQVDMLAAIEANRAARRAQESALARGNPSDASTKGDALDRNVRSLSGREGVGGVFQVLRKGVRTGEFAFNGFRNAGQRRWREVIEVDAGPGGDLELAMIRRMIDLIRTHYTGDFQWESHRIGRVVVLSARPADQLGLEEFLMKEFFGTPLANPRAPERRARAQ